MKGAGQPPASVLKLFSNAVKSAMPEEDAKLGSGVNTVLQVRVSTSHLRIKNSTISSFRSGQRIPCWLLLKNVAV